MEKIKKQEEEYYEEILEKVLLKGSSGVGKTSILLKLVMNKFFPKIKKTNGVDVFEKKVEKEDIKIVLELWDTSGSEDDLNLISSYYKGTRCIILVFDITDENSFKELSNFKKEINNFVDEKEFMVIVLGNKSDLISQRKVLKKDIEEFVNLNKYLYMEVSAKNDICGNIKKVFDYIGDKFYSQEKEYLESLKNHKNTNYISNNENAMEIED